MARTKEDFREYLFVHFLPRWAEHGQEDSGAFLYILGPDWKPAENLERRVRVQARQVWVYSQAAALGAGDFASRSAERGYDYLLNRFQDKDNGGFRLMLTPDGEPLDSNKELYEHAFVLLASAGMKDTDTAQKIWSLIEENLTADNGGFYEGADEAWNARRGARRQNPHMHLFEATLAWHERDPNGGWGDRANALLELFYAHFFDRNGDTLREHFEEDWTPRESPIEPGHHFEWVFLLEEHARLFNQAQWGDATVGLWQWARDHGRDPNGGVYDEAQPVKPTKRVWPQTEFLRALAIRYRDSLEKRWHDEAEAHLDWMRSTYCGNIFPGWEEQLDAENKLIVNEQRATTVYHIWGAFAALMEAI